MKAFGIITGVFMCVFGIYALFVPFRTFLGIGWLLGILFVVTGVQSAISALKQEKKNIPQFLWGILAVILGFWTLISSMQRVLTDMMIAYIVGFYIILYGIVQIISGYRSHKSEAKKSGIFRIIWGALCAIAGLLLIAHPVFTMISVGYAIAFAVISQGIGIIILSLKIDKPDEA